jgi:hypothetical protein
MSTPAVGSSSISNRGSCTRARAIISRRFIPPGQAARYLVALVRELQQRQIFLGALARERPIDAVEPGLVHEDGLRSFELIEVEFLGHDANAGFRRFELAIEIVAEHAHRSRRLVDQRGENSDQRGLAGAVRP